MCPSNKVNPPGILSGVQSIVGVSSLLATLGVMLVACGLIVGVWYTVHTVYDAVHGVRR